MSASSDYLRVVTDIERGKGTTAAATQRANAKIWGDTIGTLGELAGGALQQYGSQKKQEKEDQAWRDVFDTAMREYQEDQQPSAQISPLTNPSGAMTGGAPTGYNPTGSVMGGPEPEIPGVPTDPMLRNLVLHGSETGPSGPARPKRTSPFPTPQELLSRFGPQKAIPVINGIAAIQKINPQDDNDTKVKRMQAAWLALNQLPEDQRAQYFPSVQQGFAQVYGLDIGQDTAYTPEKFKAIGAGLKVLPEGDKDGLVPIPGPPGPDGTPGPPVYGVKKAGQLVYEKPEKVTPAAAPNTLTELQIDAANKNSPTSAQSAEILKALPPDFDPAKNPTEWATIQKAVRGDPEAKAMLRTYMGVHPPVPTVLQTATGPAMLNQRAGTASPITVDGEPVKPAVTQPQALDATFAKRLDDSSVVLEKVGDDITKMDFLTFKAQGLMPPAAQSKLFQQYDQASRNLINAIMRRESGAAIANDEWVNARLQYLPQPGDSPEVKKQKKQNRERQREGFIQGAGPAYTPSVETVRVKGPKGETGTVPKGTPLPPGWSLR